MVSTSFIASFFITFAFWTSLSSAFGDCDSYLGCHNSSSPLGTFSKASVVTDASHCAPLGRQILEQGGSAADAAITVLLCMGVVNPQSSGLGGGGFITFYNSTSGKGTVIDAREAAPAAATVDMFDGNATMSELGGLSIATPGELAGLWALHQTFGRLPWASLFTEPKVLAHQGFPVGHHLAHALQKDEGFIKNSNLRNLFINKTTGDVLQEGDLLRRPDLVRTFDTLATRGRDAFYKGELTQKLVAEIQSNGGIVTAADMKAYEPRVYEALEMDIANMNLTLYGVRPPGSGALLGFILNVMSGYRDLYPRAAKDSIELAGLYYHRLVEAFKFAYAERMQLGDELFDNVTEVMAKLTSRDFADGIRGRIDDSRTYFDPAHYDFSQLMPSDHGTAHMNVLDAEGNAVAVTTTVNLYFGSKILSESTGIIFNNQMDDFSSPNITSAFNVPPSKFNHIAPGKRPQSSMTPVVLVDKATKRPVLILGAEGGTQITTSVALTVIRTLLFGDSIKKAIDAPRVHDQLFPNSTGYEQFFPDELLTELEGKGHIMDIQEPESCVNGIHVTDGKIYANADYRKVGSVDGF